MTQRVTFEQHPGECENIGTGTALIFSGHIDNAVPRMTSLDIGSNHSWQRMQYLNERRNDLRNSVANGSQEYALYIGFWGYFIVEPGQNCRQISFAYRAAFEDGTEEAGLICKTNFPDPAQTQPTLDSRNSARRGDMITVCLPTYQPDMHLLEIQLNSLLHQTHENWQCIVCDDASDDHILASVQTLCDKDDRFRLIRHSTNLGFYKNFERALGYVCADTVYVALCDQDDYWYPNKLSRLAKAFTHGTSLVYSDMRLVDYAGNTISHTYWTGRKNNYTNFRVLMAANTITGAACLFDKTLLDTILPFPHRISDAYHDHWIALIAFMTGPIRYISEPLYDYRQHAGNIIGHTSFNRASKMLTPKKSIHKRLIDKATEVKKHVNSHRDSALRMRSPDSDNNTIFKLGKEWLIRRVLITSLMLKSPIINLYNHYRVFFLNIFMNQYRGLQLFATIIRLRTGTSNTAHAISSLASYDHSKHTWIRLFSYYLLDKARGHTTGNRDLYMALASLTYHFDWFGWLCRQRVKTQGKMQPKIMK